MYLLAKQKNILVDRVDVQQQKTMTANYQIYTHISRRESNLLCAIYIMNILQIYYKHINKIWFDLIT